MPSSVHWPMGFTFIKTPPIKWAITESHGDVTHKSIAKTLMGQITNSKMTSKNLTFSFADNNIIGAIQFLYTNFHYFIRRCRYIFPAIIGLYRQFTMASIY